MRTFNITLRIRISDTASAPDTWKWGELLDMIPPEHVEVRACKQVLSDRCGDTGPHGYVCTRTFDHGGKHIARTDTGTICEEWRDP